MIRLATVLAVFVAIGIYGYLANFWLITKCNFESKYQVQANAGCLIRIGVNKAVFVKNRIYWNRLSLPGGTNSSGETAECTAFRETFEETGLVVEIGKLLAVDYGNFHIFECKIKSGRIGTPVMFWHEIGGVEVLNPSDIQKSDARLPSQIKLIQGLMKND